MHIVIQVKSKYYRISKVLFESGAMYIAVPGTRTSAVTVIENRF